MKFPSQWVISTCDKLNSWDVQKSFPKFPFPFPQTERFQPLWTCAVTVSKWISVPSQHLRLQKLTHWQNFKLSVVLCSFSVWKKWDWFPQEARTTYQVLKLSVRNTAPNTHWRKWSPDKHASLKFYSFLKFRSNTTSSTKAFSMTLTTHPPFILYSPNNLLRLEWNH